MLARLTGPVPGGLRMAWMRPSAVAPIADALVNVGADERTARADARHGVAVVRGLLLDFLATGDRTGVTDAYQRFLQHASASAALPPASG